MPASPTRVRPAMPISPPARRGSARTRPATSPTRSTCCAASTAAIPACSTWRLSLSPERSGPRLAPGSRRRVRARAAVRRPPDLRGRPPAEHARRGRDRSRLARPAPRHRNPGQIRAARLRAWRRDRVRRRLARRPPDARPRRGAGRGRMPGCRSCPTTNSIARVIDAASDGPASERALGFGGEQLLLQHRGLFDLLEAGRRRGLDYETNLPSWIPLHRAERMRFEGTRIMSRPTTSRSRSMPRSSCAGPCWSRASPAPARPSWPTRSPPRSARR